MDIEAIIDIQEKLQLTDTQFADKIGCRRDHWNKIKKGHRPLNDRFLMRVYRAFPESIIFLPSNATIASKVATTPAPEHHQTRQDGYTGDFLWLLRHPYLCYRLIRYKLCAKSKSSQ